MNCLATLFPRILIYAVRFFTSSLIVILLTGSFSAGGRLKPDEIWHPTGSLLSLQPCKLAGSQRQGLCGSYSVFENRLANAGRTINLSIAVLPSINQPPKPDPVFILAGGPGQSSIDLINENDRGFPPSLGDDRDLVFVDQRGTGRSHPLNCDKFLRSLTDIYPVDQISKCRDDLEQTADLTQYSTSIATDDLEEVREALGYGKINLFGGSYGAIVAQDYLRRHQSHVRSLLLAGSAWPGIKIPLPFAKGTDHALRRLFRDCKSDEDCNRHFPRLRQEFAFVLNRFKNGSIETEFTDPRTNQQQKVSINRDIFCDWLFSMLYINDSASLVPILIHKAFEKDYSTFILLAGPSTTGSRQSLGEYLSVTCSEDVQFITEKEILKSTRGTVLGDFRVRSLVRTCQEWPKASVQRNFLDAVKSRAPVLMISGYLDPATPYWLSKSALSQLSNGWQLVIKGMGHQIDFQCVEDIYQTFINHLRLNKDDTDCVGEVMRPPFRMTLSHMKFE